MRSHYRPWFRPEDGRPDQGVQVRPLITPEEREQIRRDMEDEGFRAFLGFFRQRGGYVVRLRLE